MTLRASLVACLGASLALGGCAHDDEVGGLALALGDPAGVLDDASSVGVWVVRFYDGMPSCPEAMAFEGDIVEGAPAGFVEATVTVSPSSGRASLEVERGVYAIVVEAYQPNAEDPSLSDIIGLGCAEVQVTGDGDVFITIAPRPGF